MKRFIFYLVLAILLSAYWHARRPAPAWHGPPYSVGPDGRLVTHRGHRHGHAPTAREFVEARDHAVRAIAAARDEARAAYREASDEVRHAWHEARAELRAVRYEKDRAARRPMPPVPPLPPVPPPPPGAPAPRESVEGLPVAIVPGTAVTQAVAEPPRTRAQTEAQTQTAPAAASAGPAAARWVEGRISATEERARADAERALRDEIRDWLMADVPIGWGLPMDLVRPMYLETETRPVVKDYGTLYVTRIQADFSPEHRAEFLKAHHRDLVRDRLALLGGILAMALIGLGAVAGYIHADEATRGYCTNRLRLLAAAGVGAAGTTVYYVLR